MKNIQYLLIILLYNSLFSCTSTLQHRSMSVSVEESKQRNVFICEYKLNYVNGITKILPKEIWLEKWWNEGEMGKTSNFKVAPQNTFTQLVFNVDSTGMSSYSNEWTILVGQEKKILRQANKNLLICDFTDLLNRDSIRLSVLLGSDFNIGEGKRQILGEFTLLRQEF